VAVAHIQTHVQKVLGVVWLVDMVVTQMILAQIGKTRHCNQTDRVCFIFLKYAKKKTVSCFFAALAHYTLSLSINHLHNIFNSSEVIMQ
jgi:hypothetical protein